MESKVWMRGQSDWKTREFYSSKMEPPVKPRFLVLMC